MANEKFREFECIRPVGHKFRITAKIGKKGPHWSRGFHTGTDFATPIGTPCYAIRGGKIELAGSAPRLGLRVWVNSYQEIGEYENIWHGYCHLSDIYVKPNQHVRVGQPLGLTGNSGNSTGPHLHFQVETRIGTNREFLKPVFL